MTPDDVQVVSGWSTALGGGLGAIVVAWLMWFVTRGKIVIRAVSVRKLEEKLEATQKTLDNQRSEHETEIAIADARVRAAEERAQRAEERERQTNERLIEKLEEAINESRRATRVIESRSSDGY